MGPTVRMGDFTTFSLLQFNQGSIFILVYHLFKNEKA